MEQKRGNANSTHNRNCVGYLTGFKTKLKMHSQGTHHIPLMWMCIYISLCSHRETFVTLYRQLLFWDCSIFTYQIVLDNFSILNFILYSQLRAAQNELCCQSWSLRFTHRSFCFKLGVHANLTIIFVVLCVRRIFFTMKT